MRERHKLFERFGRVDVPRDEFDALPDWVQQMMSRLIVLRVDHALYHDTISFTALCPQFAAVLLGDIPPLYRPVVEDGLFLRFK